MKKITWFLVLALLLMANTITAMAEGDEGYFNDFNDAEAGLADWTVSDSTKIYIDNSQLVFHYTSGSAIFDKQTWSGGNFVSDFCLSILQKKIVYYFNYSKVGTLTSTYKLQFDQANSKVALYKITNNTSETLAEVNTVPEIRSAGSNVKVCYYNGTISTFMGNRKLFDFVDKSPLSSGKMGFASESGAFGKVDNFNVTIPNNNPVLVDGTKPVGNVYTGKGSFDMVDWISDGYQKTSSIASTGNMGFGTAGANNCMMTYIRYALQGSYKADVKLTNGGASTGNVAFIGFNIQNSNNYYKLELQGGAVEKAPEMILKKIVEGTETVLSSVSYVSYNVTQRVRIAYENGGNISIYTVNSDNTVNPIMENISDTSFSNGYIGVGVKNTISGIQGLWINENEVMIFGETVADNSTGKTISFRALTNGAVDVCKFYAAAYTDGTMMNANYEVSAIPLQYSTQNPAISINIPLTSADDTYSYKIFGWKMDTQTPLTEASVVQ